ncbi:MAG TPA: CCA tRNA nucleotidyltransferase, partial [Planctomycetota bacterium]|nr:CCA tRNA nucleotidyltransferase [Planctomycetota bacterium]
FPHAIGVGESFGVMMVVLHAPADGGGTAVLTDQSVHDADRKFHYEVATFRKDGPYDDGRRPNHIHFSSPEEDVHRRDFTINGLLYDPAAEMMYDYVGGVADMNARVLRTIGNPEARFTEDGLRLMRAVRFATRFDFKVDPATESAVVKLAPTIKRIAYERIRDELTKILTGPRPQVGLRRLQELGLLEHILPEVARMMGVEQPPQYHPEGDVWVHTLLLFEIMDRTTPPDQRTEALVYGVLFHDVGKPLTFEQGPDRIRFPRHESVGADLAKELCERLRMSNDRIDAVVELVADHMKFKELDRMRESTLKRFLVRPTIDTHLELHRLDCLASHGSLDMYEYAKKKLAEIDAEEVKAPPLVKGDDLIALGYQPGPVFKKMLEAVDDLRLEGKLHDKAGALEWLKTNWPAPKEA